MKNILLVYRSGTAIDEFKNSFNKYKKDKITVIVENKVARNLMKYFYKDILFVTIEEFFKGELDNMQFDYIVGNPPYQYPKGTSSRKKLYIDITLKMLELIKKDGIIDFIVPKAILYQQKKDIKKVLKEKLFYVDFSTDNDFNVGQTIINFKLKEKTDDDITVIRSDNTNITVTNIDDISDNDEIELLSILNKIDFNKNSKNKLQIYKIQARDAVPADKIFIDKTQDHNVPVICAWKKYKDYIGYTDKVYYDRYKLIIPFGGDWKTGCKITNTQTDCHFFASRDTQNNNELQNLKNYLESKLISYCVINYSNKIKPGGYYEFLLKLSDLDFTKSYTEQELYKEFNITEQEQEEIERWYKEWK